MKKLDIFPPVIFPLWTCIYLNIDSKAECSISKSSYSEQRGSCEPLRAKSTVFLSTLPQRMRNPLTLLLLPLDIAAFCLSCWLIFEKQRFCRYFSSLKIKGVHLFNSISLLITGITKPDDVTSLYSLIHLAPLSHSWHCSLCVLRRLLWEGANDTCRRFAWIPVVWYKCMAWGL